MASIHTWTVFSYFSSSVIKPRLNWSSIRPTFSSDSSRSLTFCGGSSISFIAMEMPDFVPYSKPNPLSLSMTPAAPSLPNTLMQSETKALNEALSVVLLQKRSCGGKASLNIILPTVVFILSPFERSEGSRTVISAPSSMMPNS